MADTPSVPPPASSCPLAPAETWVQLEGLLMLRLEISEGQREIRWREMKERQGRGSGRERKIS